MIGFLARRATSARSAAPAACWQRVLHAQGRFEILSFKEKKCRSGSAAGKGGGSRFSIEGLQAAASGIGGPGGQHGQMQAAGRHGRDDRRRAMRACRRHRRTLECAIAAMMLDAAAAFALVAPGGAGVCCTRIDAICARACRLRGPSCATLAMETHSGGFVGPPAIRGRVLPPAPARQHSAPARPTEGWDRLQRPLAAAVRFVLVSSMLWRVALVPAVSHSATAQPAAADCAAARAAASEPRPEQNVAAGPGQRRVAVTCNAAALRSSAGSQSQSSWGGAGGRLGAAGGQALLAKFRQNWQLYCTIPVVAGLLNWATNNLAVKMIFYPLNFWGLKIRTWPETPLGLIGWTGIVPAKAKTMAARMVQMVTASLINVTEVAARIEPAVIATTFKPMIPQAVAEAAVEGGFGWLGAGPLRGATAGISGRLADDFVRSFTVKMCDNIADIMDLEHLVVGKFVQEKKLLVELFQTCGKVELAFVIRSGLVLGFLLGIIQMAVWVAWDPWWSLAVGGALVGYITNFIAIKSIFEPVDPVHLGPFKIQGLFLTRQHEVSAEFASFLREKVLTPDAIWREILYGARRARFRALLEAHVSEFDAFGLTSASLTAVTPSGRPLKTLLADRIFLFLQEHHPALHPYMEVRLDLETTMRTKMRQMSAAEFEGVLHPIFEEDELTLICTGAVLGLVVGFLQSLAPY